MTDAPQPGRPRHQPEPYMSEAWLLEGMTRSIPGTLAWDEGRLRFATADEHVFDIAHAELTYLEFPWYYFGGGVKLGTAHSRYRLSFVRPNGAEYALMRGAAAVGSPIAVLGAAAKIVDMRSGRRIGQRWREVLVAIRGPEQS